MGGSLAPVRVAGFTWNGWQPSAVYALKPRPFGIGQLTGMFGENISDAVLIDYVLGKIDIEIHQLSVANLKLITIKQQENMRAY